MDVSPSGSGHVKMDKAVPDSYPFTMSFTDCTPVSLEARPEPGYLFSHWSGNLSGNTNPTTVITDNNKTITANFSQARYNWWLIIGIAGGGAIIGTLLWILIRKRTT